MKKTRKPSDPVVHVPPDGQEITWTPTHKPGDGGVVITPDGEIGIVIPWEEAQEAAKGQSKSEIEDYMLACYLKAVQAGVVESMEPDEAFESKIRRDKDFAVAYVKALQAAPRARHSTRIREGLAKAREKGVPLGRPPGSSTGSLVLRGDKREAARRRLTRGGTTNSYRAIARTLGVSLSTIQRLAKAEGIIRRKPTSPASS